MVRDLNGDPVYLQAALDRSLETHRSQRRLGEMLAPDPGRHLQRELTEPIMAQKAATLYSTLDTPGQRRLLSVASPHALQWTMGPNPWIRLTADEFRCALRWVTGTPMRPGEYRCPYCGKQADNMGAYAVACLVGSSSKGPLSGPRPARAAVARSRTQCREGTEPFGASQSSAGGSFDPPSPHRWTHSRGLHAVDKDVRPAGRVGPSRPK